MEFQHQSNTQSWGKIFMEKSVWGLAIKISYPSSKTFNVRLFDAPSLNSKYVVVLIGYEH